VGLQWRVGALSGVTANPAVGAAADRFVRAGATVVLAETTEMIGTAHILKRRGATPEIGSEVERRVNQHHAHVRASLGALAGMVIAPGNVEGGLSSITEKSLGRSPRAARRRSRRWSSTASARRSAVS
jgi:altronate dehydratase large subunit